MKSFMKFMFMAASAMTVMLFTSCDKDDDGGSAGGFDVHVPSFVKGTTPIRVDLGVNATKRPRSLLLPKAMHWALSALLRTPSSTRIMSMPAS